MKHHIYIYILFEIAQYVTIEIKYVSNLKKNLQLGVSSTTSSSLRYIQSCIQITWKTAINGVVPDTISNEQAI